MITSKIPSILEIENLLEFNQKTNKINYSILILRNHSIESIDPYLKYLSLQINLNVKIIHSNYDNIIQDLIDPESNLLNRVNPDLIFLTTPLMSLNESLIKDFNSFSFDSLESAIIEIKFFLSSVITLIRKKTQKMIIWKGFESELFPSTGIIDSNLKNGQNSVIDELNNYLKNILIDAGNAFFLNPNLLLMEIGFDEYYDWRFWHIAKSLYSKKALFGFSKEIITLMKGTLGFSKKVIALDCDNTIWGGIIGEDGFSGISIGFEYPGSLYRDLQKRILDLKNLGFIITICSKNNEEDVLHVFNKHPGMILKKEHIAVWKVNWNDKVSNIREISKELNVSTDSIILIDDSNFEIEMINKFLPEVETFNINNHSYLNSYFSILRNVISSSKFSSEEDKKRTLYYSNEKLRSEAKANFENIDEYIRSLNINLQIFPIMDHNIPRVSQLTQKTNQFNLTTKRYTEIEIKSLKEDKNVKILCLNTFDKFGDMGLVGCIILKKNIELWEIDSFMMSCRILSRKIEYRFISEVLKMLKLDGATEIRASFIPTEKNSQVSDFYDKFGFKSVDLHLDGKKKYKLNLGNFTSFFDTSLHTVTVG